MDVAIMYLEQRIEDPDPMAIHEGRLAEVSRMEQVMKMDHAKATGARIWMHRWVITRKAMSFATEWW